MMIGAAAGGPPLEKIHLFRTERLGEVVKKTVFDREMASLRNMDVGGGPSRSAVAGSCHFLPRMKADADVLS